MCTHTRTPVYKKKWTHCPKIHSGLWCNKAVDPWPTFRMFKDVHHVKSGPEEHRVEVSGGDTIFKYRKHMSDLMV
jgi:hypothetical protein